MRFIFALLLIAVASPVSGDVILRDTISDGGFNTTGEPGVLNMSPGYGAEPALFDSTVGIIFSGNGQRISSVEVIWQYGDQASGVFNSGNIQQFDWQLSLFLDPVDFSTEGALGRSGSVSPDFTTIFANPSNSDYATVIGNSGPANNHLARFDLSGLGWKTNSGQNHIITVVPTSTMPGGSTIAALSYSPAVVSTLDLYDQSFDNGTPPETFAQRGFPFDSVAARITAAVPEPNTLFLITLSLPALLRRRR